MPRRIAGGFRFLIKALHSTTTLKSAIAAASSRNGTRIYPFLLCHFMTQNQKLRCSPETVRLSFYDIQGVPQKNLSSIGAKILEICS